MTCLMKNVNDSQSHFEKKYINDLRTLVCLCEDSYCYIQTVITQEKDEFKYPHRNMETAPHSHGYSPSLRILCWDFRLDTSSSLDVVRLIGFRLQLGCFPAHHDLTRKRLGASQRCIRFFTNLACNKHATRSEQS